MAAADLCTTNNFVPEFLESEWLSRYSDYAMSLMSEEQFSSRRLVFCSATRSTPIGTNESRPFS